MRRIVEQEYVTWICLTHTVAKSSKFIPRTNRRKNVVVRLALLLLFSYLIVVHLFGGLQLVTFMEFTWRGNSYDSPNVSTVSMYCISAEEIIVLLCKQNVCLHNSFCMTNVPRTLLFEKFSIQIVSKMP